MMNVNKVISIISLSLILVVGIGIASGIFLDVDRNMRIGVGVLVGLYSAVRLYFIVRRSGPKSMIGERLRQPED